MRRTPIASHRGGAILWPENSLMAFRQALRLPVEQLELDVHASADGEAMVMHDATLDRMTDAVGPLCARSAAALGAVRVKGTGGEAVPRLAEVAALMRPGSQQLRLEVKADRDGRPYPGLLDRCIAVLDQFGLRQRTWLMSFQPLTLIEAAAVGGGFAGVVLLLESHPWRGMGMPGAQALARACQANEIGLPLGEVDTATVAQCRQQNLGISVWGANDEAGIRKALGLGLDAMTTDDPVLAPRLRDE
jgi:glycerophosphoryl diester phosphodiesterase